MTAGARNLSDELHRVGLGYVWLDRDRRDLKSVSKLDVTVLKDNETVKVKTNQ